MGFNGLVGCLLSVGELVQSRFGLRRSKIYWNASECGIRSSEVVPYQL